MSIIAIEHEMKSKYPLKAPYRPSEKYPETPFDEIGTSRNYVYEMVRNCFVRMEFDIDNFGKAEWNPLREIISPGDRVLLKPNMVMHVNKSDSGTECLYTHPSVVAAVLDYVYIALKGEGHIIVGDAPVQECDFNRLVHESGYDKVINYFKEKNPAIDITLMDFRDLKSNVRKDGLREYLEKECSEGIIVDLGENSEFAADTDYTMENIRITNYDPNILKKHHNSKKHEYCINKNVLNADVIINLPKPKTHRKAGVTISLKNMVGINARKEYLPHHTNGSVIEGGDQYLYKSIFKRMKNYVVDRRNIFSQTKKNIIAAKIWKLLEDAITAIIHIVRKDRYYDGNWYGNHTICKTVMDINKILFYCDKKGNMQSTRQRKYLIVADMIVCGEKEGPVAPTDKYVGCIAMGSNPESFDRVIATIMGAKIDKIPTLMYAKNMKGEYLLCDNSPIVISSNNDEWNRRKVEEISDSSKLNFLPSVGWEEAFIANSKYLTFEKKIIRQIYNKCLEILYKISPTLFVKYKFKKVFGYKINLRDPKTFNEKLQWIKLYWKSNIMVKCADKYAVRDYVACKGLSDILNDLYYVYDNPDDIKWDILPNSFVIKMNNGCGTNIICRDKSNMDWDRVVSKIKCWMNKDYSLISGEWFYKEMQPRIMIEKYLVDEKLDDLRDFKFACFNGEPKYVIVHTGRGGYNHNAIFYDMNWEKIPVKIRDYGVDENIEKPKQFSYMIEIAKKLSEEIPFVRVDLYEVGDRVIFGEMTFLPTSGFMKYEPDTYDYLWGQWLTLPKKQPYPKK